MGRYRKNSTLGEGLSEYLISYNLGDGGYTAKWFKIKFFWKFVVTLPNIDNRVRAVKFHDLHHVLTEYETGLRGEAEIGAWEIASGCGKYYSAWMLNIGTLVYGIFLYPSFVYRAFIRGRHSANLYTGAVYDKILLGRSVAEVRDALHIPEIPLRKRLSDVIAFGLWVVFVVTIILLPVLIVLSVVVM